MRPATDERIITRASSVRLTRTLSVRSSAYVYTVAELAACGRARWKIENETFNVLKCGGYNLEHNFGHGKDTLASVLVVLNLLAFAYHTVAALAVSAWRDALAAKGTTYRFFEHLRTITTYVVFQTWTHVLRSIAEATIRPP